MRGMILLVLAAAMVPAVPGLGLAQDVDPFGFSEDQYSSWGIVDAPYPYKGYDAGGNYIDYGCFPVGNGLVFAHLGVDEDFNTLRGITGPGYQTREDDGAWAVWKEGNWPDSRIKLVNMHSKAGPPDNPRFEPVRWTSQSIQQLRGAAMVRTMQTDGKMTLYCLTYVHPTLPIIRRNFILTGDFEQDTYGLMFDRSNMKYDQTGTLFASGDGRMEICRTVPEVHQNPQGETVLSGIAVEYERRPARDWNIDFFFSKAKDIYQRDRPDQIDPDKYSDVFGAYWLDHWQEREQYAYDYWQEWSSHNLQFDTRDQRLDDMMAQLPVIIETERDYYSGGTSPMVSYHGYWVRDSMGPLLVDLANGRFENVMRMLRYHRACCLKYKASNMLVPLDMDLSDLPGWKPDSVAQAALPAVGDESQAQRPAPPAAATYPTAGDLSGIGTAAADWEGTPVEHAEVPSLIVLQHFLLWREMTAAGRGPEADAFIREAWAFITHNLFTMQFNLEYGVYFHGDETYTQGALYSTYDRPESGQIGYPNGYIPTADYTSYDNTILHRAAAAVIERLAVRFGDSATETRAKALKDQLDGIVQNAFRGSPAIATFTGQRWRGYFSNIDLRKYWLDLPYGVESTDLEFEDLDYYLDSLHLPATTLHSDYMTGHALGYWLTGAKYFEENLAVRRGYDDQDEVEKPFQYVLRNPSSKLIQDLIDTATPEGSWCEVLNGKGMPVDIYGRTNRIRPWESGVNYYALAQYLGSYHPQTAEMKGTTSCILNTLPGVDEVPEGKQLLVITKSADWLEHVKLDYRFADLKDSQIVAWDAGLPFTQEALKSNLHYSWAGHHETMVPYLYFDRGVMGGLDRRTMKDHDFWYGEEMTALLEEYEAAGGTVLYEDDLQPKLKANEVVALKVLVVLFPRTFTHEMDRAEQEQFHREVGKWIDWYDEVAGDRLRLELDYLQINTKLDPLQCGPQGENVYWMGASDVEDMLRARGVADGEYDAVCCFWAWDRDAASLPGGETAQQAYGGAAQGPGDDMEFLGPAGRTGYFGSAVLTNFQQRTGNNATHEFLHVLDAMFEMAGDSRIFHPDQMARNMDKLLEEVPGGFESLGYTDDEMRALAERELRKEDSFPWETQLVYYKQAIQRIPREDYAELLKHYGTRVERKGWKRLPLYEQMSMPGGAQTAQINKVPPGTYVAIDPNTGGYVVGNDLTLEEEPQYDWQSGWVIGWSAVEEDYSFLEGVDVYREAEFTGPWEYELTLGAEPPLLAAGLATTVKGYPVEGAKAWLEVDGQSIDMENVGDNGYRCAISGDLGDDFTATLHAEYPDTVITPRPVHVTIKAPWELSTKFVENDAGLEELQLLFTGPEDTYKLDLNTEDNASSVQQMLVKDGLLPDIGLSITTYAKAGEPKTVGLEQDSIEPLQYKAYTVKVQNQAGLSFTHHFPATKHWSAPLLAHPQDLPDYIPRAHRITPTIDGNLDEWSMPPSLVLTPGDKYAHAFSGEFDGPEDCNVKLWLGYDDDNLYVAGDVTDDMTPGNGTWDSDRINLCFDAELNTTPATYPGGAVGHTGWSRDDYWVFLNPCLPDGPQAMRLGGERPSGSKNGYYGPVAGSEAKVVQRDGGYRFEWAIPWSSLPYLEARPGGLAGFTFFYSDYDKALSELMYVTDWGGPGGIEWRFWDCGLLYFEK